MRYAIDQTHDPELESWIESANDPATDFPLQNLPIATVLHETADGERIGAIATRVGEFMIDISALLASELVAVDDPDWQFPDPSETGAERPWGGLRRGVQRLLQCSNAALREHADRDLYVLPIEQTPLGLPYGDAVPNFTDFYASIHHATNVGSMFRPEQPLLANYTWMPIGYHGRASSVVPSGTALARPTGQLPSGEGKPPTFGPTQRLDYEVELGAVIGRGSALGEPVSADEAEAHMLGLCLLNDWSARDMQRWEYQPLGPFLSKSFATSVSPYVVTMEALAPFRVPRAARAAGDPEPLAYLDGEGDRRSGGFDITVEAYLQSERMARHGIPPMRLSRGGFQNMFWTFGQMIAHHTSNGCNLRLGDVLGSGTISGPGRANRGCLLELTWAGDPWADPPVRAGGDERVAIELPTGELRVFLEDGDEVILKACCEREGYRRIGFGECRGTVAAARSRSTAGG